MFLCPASLLHGGDLRTGARGNERAHFAFYLERKGVEKSISEVLATGCEDREFRNDYLTGDHTSNRTFLVDAIAKVEANNAQAEEYRKNAHKKAPPTSKKSRTAKRNAQETEEWVTDELKEFADLFFV